MKLGKNKLQELKDKKISIEELNERYFINSQSRVEVENVLKLLNENICDFKQIVDKCKSIQGVWYNDTSLKYLLWNKELFQELFENNRLTKDDLKYLLNKIDDIEDLYRLSRNTSLLKYIVDNGLFQEVMAEYKKFKNLEVLLRDEELFEEVTQNDKLTQEDLKYLLNRIDNKYKLEKLCKNTPLIKCILNEFVLNKEDVDRLNRMTEDNSWCEERNIHTVFEYIEHYHKNNEEILKLNELNKYVCSFELNENQRSELADVLKDNEQAQNILKQILDSNLENQYDSKSLKNLLMKDNEKKKLKMNF